jgi:putative transposase
MKNERYLWSEVSFRKRNHLPHIDVPGGLYFVTYCLADAIPPGYAAQLEQERRRMLASIRERFGRVSPVDLRQTEKWMRREIFAAMDCGWGRCELAIPEVATVITESLLHFNQIRYTLFSHCVMPNHVHVVFQPERDWPWWKITGSWKSFTARKANTILGRSGTFWQDDSYDVLIRSAAQLEKTTRYVLENPTKAGLVDWPWCGQHPQTSLNLSRNGGRASSRDPARRPRRGRE